MPKNKSNFRQNYRDQISKKLDIENEVFIKEYIEIKQPIGLAIFGLALGVYSFYLITHGALIFGVIVLASSIFFTYRGIKKRQIVFKVSKNGIWTPEYGFIYYRHIERFEPYRYIGIHTAIKLKIYIKDFKKYKMTAPFLEVSLSQIDQNKDLEQTIINGLAREQSQK